MIFITQKIGAKWLSTTTPWLVLFLHKSYSIAMSSYFSIKAVEFEFM